MFDNYGQGLLRVNRLAAESEANSSSDKYSSLFATFSLEETRIVYIIQLAFDSTCLNSIWKLERQSQTRAWEVEKHLSISQFYKDTGFLTFNGSVFAYIILCWFDTFYPNIILNLFTFNNDRELLINFL